MALKKESIAKESSQPRNVVSFYFRVCQQSASIF